MLDGALYVPLMAYTPLWQLPGVDYTFSGVTPKCLFLVDVTAPLLTSPR